MKDKICVIMAGGIGSRFWPLSLEGKPKQFLDILGVGKSFIRQTYERFLPIIKSENIYIATNHQYKDLVKEHIPELDDSQIILEPLRRNTAPCIAYVTHKIKSIVKDDDAVMIITPSDHYITNELEFLSVIGQSCGYASTNNSLVTIGITPTRPETGYGYIQKSDIKIPQDIFKVKTFTEKPNAEMAQIFIDSGEFLWNSGIFIWSINSILTAFEELQPELNSSFKAGVELYNTPSESEFINKVFSECQSISIDYAIMEKATNVYVTQADFGWSDIGTWSALYEHSDKMIDGNSINASKEILTYNTKNCIINLPAGKRAVIDGLEDYIIADSGDILMICPREKESRIKMYADNINDVSKN